MKKTILTIAVATLCLFFKARSQNLAEDVTSKGIQIGQRIPNVKLENIQNYKAKTASIADFEGKLLILDFWATWCSPCLAMRPKMEALQQKFNGKVQFLSLTYEQPEIVLPFLEKLNKGKPAIVPDVMNEQTLHRFFPHIYLPHYVWIDRHGIVKAITGMHEVTAENIEKMIGSDEIFLDHKKDFSLKYDDKKPLLINGNGGDGSNLIYHSTLSGYTEGLPSATNLAVPDSSFGARFTFTNCPLIWLYKHAYGDGFTTFFSMNRVVFQVKDPENIYSNKQGKVFASWLKMPGHAYCYELQLPASLKGNFYKIMKEDLRRLFPQYEAVIETQKVKSMVLVLIPGQDLLKTNDKNAKVEESFHPKGFKLKNSFLSSFVARIQLLYQRNSALPFLDDTNYVGRIDMEVEADLSNIIAMNKGLKKYHLQWVEKDIDQEILVIRDQIEPKDNVN